jgi:hypothetical protein
MHFGQWSGEWFVSCSICEPCRSEKWNYRLSRASRVHGSSIVLGCEGRSRDIAKKYSTFASYGAAIASVYPRKKELSVKQRKQIVDISRILFIDAARARHFLRRWIETSKWELLIIFFNPEPGFTILWRSALLIRCIVKLTDSRKTRGTIYARCWYP